MAARLAATVAAQVAALATSLASPLGPDKQAAEWEPYYALLQILSGQSKAKPTARFGIITQHKLTFFNLSKLPDPES